MIPFREYVRVLPEIIVALTGLAIMMAEPLFLRRSRRLLGSAALAGLLAGLAATVFLSVTGNTGSAFYSMIQVDAFSIYFHCLIIATSVVAVLVSITYLETQQIFDGEYYALILFGTVGMMLMSSAVELVLVFIALEISSISTYVLVGFRRGLAPSTEAALKYFLLGSFATAFFLYGIALMFGATGSTSVIDIAAAISSHKATPLVFLSTALMFVGIGFKVGSAPFHVWTPDVYEGSPTPIVALMSTGPKIAAFAVLLRILIGASTPGWFWLVWLSAALSMTLGNLGALLQTNVKRLLAYSSIAHAGYLLVAFAAAGRTEAIASAIFYLTAYAAMNLGAFCVIGHLAGEGERYVNIDDYAGLGVRSPLLAAALTLFLLSLIGIPATGGFFAKFYVFSAAMQANLIGLTIIAVINSGVAAYYYLRLVVVMYMREPNADLASIQSVPPSVLTALGVSALATFYLGIIPGRVVDLALRSASKLAIGR